MDADESPKRNAIRYWEIRRIVWNLLLVPPSLLSYWVTSEFASSLGCPPSFDWPGVAAFFCFSAVGANVCFSFAYVIEFWIQGALAEDGYRKFGRPVLFCLGSLLGVGLALVGGEEIARMQYPRQ